MLLYSYLHNARCFVKSEQQLTCFYHLSLFRHVNTRRIDVVVRDVDTMHRESLVKQPSLGFRRTRSGVYRVGS